MKWLLEDGGGKGCPLLKNQIILDQNNIRRQQLVCIDVQHDLQQMYYKKYVEIHMCVF